MTKTAYASEAERRTLEWWPEFVREMFAAIGAALNCRPLDPDVDYNIAASWPEHRIEITYASAKDLEEEFGGHHGDGTYLVEIHGPRFGGARWEFQQEDLDALVAAALSLRPTPPA
jgi:hypothetical protein